jgi:hypothetical protein
MMVVETRSITMDLPRSSRFAVSRKVWKAALNAVVLIFNRIEEEQKSKILSTCQKTSRRQQEFRDRASVEDFNTRMANDIREREEKKTSREQTARAMIGNEHNFKPKLHVVESLIKHRQGGLDRLSQPSRRYTEEYQPPDDEIEQMKKESILKDEEAIGITHAH